MSAREVMSSFSCNLLSHEIVSFQDCPVLFQDDTGGHRGAAHGLQLLQLVLESRVLVHCFVGQFDEPVPGSGIMDLDRSEGLAVQIGWVKVQCGFKWDINPQRSVVGLHKGIVRHVAALGWVDAGSDKQGINGDAAIVANLGFTSLGVWQQFLKDGILQAHVFDHAGCFGVACV